MIYLNLSPTVRIFLDTGGKILYTVLERRKKNEKTCFPVFILYFFAYAAFAHRLQEG